ncbi:MAG: hypothetical protein LUD51_03595 [Clostridia bacterium]|nr:hypothetical protein [Clostridia bacterium]
MINRVFHRPVADEIKDRTFSDYIHRVGEGIISTEQSASNNILQVFGFDSKTGQLKENVTLPNDFTGNVEDEDGDSTPTYTEEDIQGAIDEINGSRDKKITAKADDIQAEIETNSDTAVYISIDHIGVTRQKDIRKGNAVRETKYVQNCVAHIQQSDNRYVLTSVDTDSLFKAVLAFLLANNLLKYNLVFFTDGATDLKSKIASFFSFRPYKLILDWYHIEKRIYEILSMAVSGNKAKKQGVLENTLGYLWVGDVDGAANFIKSLPNSDIKNAAKVQEVLNYLDKKAPNMACYAVRKQLGLRVSSNRVEKENDMLVASRQKHNGMSWTKDGSGSLAAIEMIYQNKQEKLWFQKKQILGITMVASVTLKAA